MGTNDFDSIHMLMEQLKILIDKVDSLSNKVTEYEVSRAKDSMLLQVTATKAEKLESDMNQLEDVINKHIQADIIRQKQYAEQKEEDNKKINTRIAILMFLMAVISLVIDWYISTIK